MEAGLLDLFYGLLCGAIGGLLGGGLAGLAGLGGGLVYVPFFFFMIPSDSPAIPVFASLVAVAFTSCFSLRAHIKLGHVDGEIFRRMLPGLVVGSMLGLWSTLRLPEKVVLLTLALLEAWVAWDYGKRIQIQMKPNWLPLASGPIGYLAGVLGLGGGSLLVPLLRRHVPLRMAVGTSAAFSATTAFAAVASNVAFEPLWQDLLRPKMGFLLGVWSGVLMISWVSARYAARLHATLPERNVRLALQSVFAWIAIGLLIAAIFY